VIVVLLGAPGSGKGTQGRRLSDHLQAPYLASGDLLRHAIEQQTDLGLKVKEYVERGLYVPDDVMVPAAIEELRRLRSEWSTPSVILDGFPRTREQAVALDSALAAESLRVDRVLYLAVPSDVLMRRLAGRYVCRSCGASYNTQTHQPRVPGVCDVCGEPLAQRVDDQASMIERRLAVYLESTVPLIAYYRERNRLLEVDGNRPQDAVTLSIVDAVGSPSRAFAQR
jgi:adenylate kinase